jgi:hypothetical protein
MMYPVERNAARLHSVGGAEWTKALRLKLEKIATQVVRDFDMITKSEEPSYREIEALRLKLEKIAVGKEIKRDRRILMGFSDGMHTGLTRNIKAGMAHPESFEHVETVFGDWGDHLIVTTFYRGKSGSGGPAGFSGAMVECLVKASCDLDGNVIEILDENYKEGGLWWVS